MFGMLSLVQLRKSQTDECILLRNLRERCNISYIILCYRPANKLEIWEELKIVSKFCNLLYAFFCHYITIA